MCHGSVHARRQQFSIVYVGELFMAAAYLKNRTPLSRSRWRRRSRCFTVSNPTSRTFVSLEPEPSSTSRIHKVRRRSPEWKVYGYSEEIKSYRAWNSKTHRIVESTNATFIETPPHLLPPPSKVSPLQDLVPSSWGIDDDTLNCDYIHTTTYCGM